MRIVYPIALITGVTASAGRGNIQPATGRDCASTIQDAHRRLVPAVETLRQESLQRYFTSEIMASNPAVCRDLAALLNVILMRSTLRTPTVKALFERSAYIGDENNTERVYLVYAALRDAGWETRLVLESVTADKLAAFDALLDSLQAIKKNPRYGRSGMKRIDILGWAHLMSSADIEIIHKYTQLSRQLNDRMEKHFASHPLARIYLPITLLELTATFDREPSTAPNPLMAPRALTWLQHEAAGVSSLLSQPLLGALDTFCGYVLDSSVDQHPLLTDLPVPILTVAIDLASPVVAYTTHIIQMINVGLARQSIAIRASTLDGLKDMPGMILSAITLQDGTPKPMTEAITSLQGVEAELSLLFSDQ